jgi:hypothetical protein
MNRRRFYAEQYGYCWSFDRSSLHKLLARGASGAEWNLDDYGRRVKCPPKYKIDFKPLDWERDDFVGAQMALKRTGDYLSGIMRPRTARRRR